MWKLTQHDLSFSQEAGSYRPSVRPERRRQLIQEMDAAIPSALQLLTTVLQQHTGALVPFLPTQKYPAAESTLQPRACSNSQQERNLQRQLWFPQKRLAITTVEHKPNVQSAVMEEPLATAQGRMWRCEC